MRKAILSTVAIALVTATFSMTAHALFTAPTLDCKGDAFPWNEECWNENEGEEFAKWLRSVGVDPEDFDKKWPNLTNVFGMDWPPPVWTAPWPEWWYHEAMLIHSCEGSWTDPNPPYFGGMQMGYDFMAAYGSEFLARWGTADNWPVWAQLTAAYRGWQARGWSPWPACSARFGL